MCENYLFYAEYNESTSMDRSTPFVKGLREQLDSTTVQSQFFMEGRELLLDLLRTGAVLPFTEIQQDVDLREKDTHNNKVGSRERGRQFKHVF